MRLRKFHKSFFLSIAIFCMSFSGFTFIGTTFTNKISAETVVGVGQPCEFKYGLNLINNNRAHSNSLGNGDYAVDLGANGKPPIANGVAKKYQVCTNNIARASISGTVTYSADSSVGYGKRIEITNSNGIVVRYAHLKSRSVEVGAIVQPGETIGIIGQTGNASFPHIHFEVCKNSCAKGNKLTYEQWKFGNTEGGFTQTYRHHFADINGDGKDDLVQIGVRGNKSWVGLANGSGNFSLWSNSFDTSEYDGGYRHHFGDVNGDGRSDLVQISIKGGQGWVALGNTDGTLSLWSTTFYTGEANGVYRHYLADVNGDGKSDLVQVSILGGQGWVGLGDANGNFNLWSSTFYTGEANGVYRHYLADVNGDGKTDLVQISIQGGQGWVALGDANGNFNVWTKSFDTGEANGTYRHYLADVNGDAKADLVQISIKGGKGWVGLGKANGELDLWTSQFDTGEAKGLYRHHLADVNGDGKSDLIQFSRPGGKGWVGLANANNNFGIWSGNIDTGEYGGN